MMVRRSVVGIALVSLLAACGGATTTPTPDVAPTQTRVPVTAQARTPIATATAIATPATTSTPLPPPSTSPPSTATPLPPTATQIPLPPTSTPVPPTATAHATSPTMETVAMGASWAHWYRDTRVLKQASDVVVMGTVAGAGRITASTAEPGIVLTDYPFTIDTVVSDPQHRLQGATITIRQTGGIVGTTRYLVEGDPLFEPNERAVLFLHEFGPGQYYVEGGPSGRFVVQNGLVRPVASDGVQLTAPMSEAAFVDSIRNR